MEGITEAPMLQTPEELIRLVKKRATKVRLGESDGDETSVQFEDSERLQLYE